MTLPPSDKKQFNVRLSELEIADVKAAADELGMTATDFIRYAVALQLQTWRSGGNKLPPAVEGKMRLADLARWEAERAVHDAKPATKGRKAR